MKTIDDFEDTSFILHHLGEELPAASADACFGTAVSPPIMQTSTFSFESFDAFRRAMADATESILYTRGNNPTAMLVEQKIAALEHAQRAKLVSSGVSAITAAVTAFVGAGDHIVVVRDCYSWTKFLSQDYLARFGVSATFIDGTDPAEFERAIRTETKVAYLESPTSMTFMLQDLRSFASIARERGIKTVIDNTWCTPLYQNPIDLGIDLVVHSATKYLGGHSDALGGVIAGSDEDVRRIILTEYMLHGPVCDPFAAWLILRGMRTLHVRMPVHFESTKKIAAKLEGHPFVERVLYPFLPSHPQYALACSQMRGGSGLFSVILNTLSEDAVRVFTDSLRFFKKAVSWGGYESLVYPAAAAYKAGTAPEDRVSLVRLHIGLENAEELLSDLEQALDRASGQAGASV